MIGTVKAIEQRLLVDGFVLRYDTGKGVDGLPPGEGAFLACSFWLADNYILQGRIAEARALFERLLALSNDVGLLAEEYDPRGETPAREFPAGVFACRAGQHRLQPDPQRRPGGAARRPRRQTRRRCAQGPQARGYGRRCDEPLAQGRGAIAERAACGGDQPAVADKSVVDAVIDGERARDAGRFQRRGQALAVVLQRIEAADDQMRRRQPGEPAQDRGGAPVGLLLRRFEIGLPDPPHLGLRQTGALTEALP